MTGVTQRESFGTAKSQSTTADAGFPEGCVTVNPQGVANLILDQFFLKTA